MGQPTQRDVHVDVPLTNISTAYIQSQDNFIATKVFPIVPVEKQTNKFYTFTKNDWFRDEAQQRADASESAGSGFGVSTDSYSCDVFALHKDLGDQVLENADSQLDLDRGATEFVTERLLLKQEIQWVTDCFGTGIWGTDATPSTLWNDFTGSDPIEDVETGKETILTNTGMLPNTLVLGYQVFRKLRNHPDVVDRIKYTTKVVSDELTAELLAAMFGIKRVLVAKAVKATNKEGETAAMAFTHGKHALLCYVAPNPSLLTPSAGYTFSWQGVSEGMGANVGITSFRMEWLKAKRIEGQVAFDNKIVGQDCGYFFSGAVA